MTKLFCIFNFVTLVQPYSHDRPHPRKSHSKQNHIFSPSQDNISLSDLFYEKGRLRTSTLKPFRLVLEPRFLSCLGYLALSFIPLEIVKSYPLSSTFNSFILVNSLIIIFVWTSFKVILSFLP